jgi:hypothetical protein
VIEVEKDMSAKDIMKQTVQLVNALEDEMESKGKSLD